MKEKEQALRYNNNKPHWSLVHFDSLEPLVRVLEYGAKKYTTTDESGNVISGRNNWKKGMPLSAIMESLFRHVNCILNGEFTDKESGQPHIGHVMANAMFASYVMKNKSEYVDIELSPELVDAESDKNCKYNIPELSNKEYVYVRGRLNRDKNIIIDEDSGMAFKVTEIVGDDDRKNQITDFPQKEWEYTANGTPIPGEAIVDENTGVEYILKSTAGNLPDDHN